MDFGDGDCDNYPASGDGFDICYNHALLGAGIELNYYYGKYPSLTFSGGALPEMSFTPGSLPTLTLDPGSLPTLNVTSAGTPPSVTPPLTFERFPSISIDQDKLNDIADGIVNDENVEPGNGDTIIRIFKQGGIKATALDIAALQAFGGGVTYESRSGDYAEWLERSDPEEEMQFGDVVGVFNGKISKNTKGADQAMVVSYKPIVLGNMPPKGKGALYEKVAFMGQVPVKVMGPVKKGDYIIPSGSENGLARAVSPKNISVINLPHVIGTSWGESDFGGVNLINVAVGLKPVEFAKVVKGQARKIVLLENELETVTNELKSENDQLKEKLAALTNRQKALEDMFLALSTDLPKEKLAMINKIGEK